MQDNALVKIKITPKQGEISYGTAYCINLNHLITALHVLDNKNNDATIALIFRGHNKPVLDYKIVYRSDKAWDIAIIELLDEALIKSLDRISMAEISSADANTEWISAGFPKFAESDAKRQREDIQGDANNSDKDAKFFHIKCDKTVTKAEWGGISGAPVFDKTTKKLLGIIKQVDTITDNTHFFVSAIWRLVRQDKTFLTYFSQENPSQKICFLAQQFLEKNKNLCEAFASISSSEQEIVTQLSTYSLPDMLDKLEDIKADLKNNDERQRELSEFSLLLLPYYFSHHAVLIDEALVTDPKNAISLECVGEVAAECCLASFNGRSAYIEKIAGATEYDDDLRVVKNKFSLAPEMGIEQTEQEVDPMESQILSSVALDSVLEKRFAKGRINPQSRINLVLERAKKKGDSFYIVVRLERASTDYKNKLAEIRKYREKYPNLIIINLSSKPELETQEENDLIALPSIIEEI